MQIKNALVNKSVMIWRQYI